MKVKTKCFICAFIMLIITITVSVFFKNIDGVFINVKYDDFWNYTFDGKYNISCIKYDLRSRYSPDTAVWLIEYKDKNGAKRSGKVYGKPDGYDDGEYDYHCIDEIRDFLRSQINDIISDEFSDKIVSQVYPEDTDIKIRISNVPGSPVSEGPDGFRLADCDLRNVGRNKELTVYITLYNDHYVLQDMEVKRMWQLEDTYCDYVGAPL